MRNALTILLLLVLTNSAVAAIDTAEKRRSVVSINGYALGAGVTPNASPDQEWRQESGYSYSGIAASGAAPTSSMLLRMLEEDWP